MFSSIICHGQQQSQSNSQNSITPEESDGILVRNTLGKNVDILF